MSREPFWPTDPREARETKRWLLGLLIVPLVLLAAGRLYYAWGPWISQGEMEHLIAEAQQLAKEADDTGVMGWKDDQVPPHIRALKPQTVSLSRDSSAGAAVLRIQTSGRFRHAGYLIVCRSSKPDYAPSGYFPTKPVYKNIFYFEE